MVEYWQSWEIRFDYTTLNPDDPFEVDDQLAHLYKQETHGLEDAFEILDDTPLYYQAVYKPAHWLLTGEVPGGDILTVPLCPASVPDKARPIGVYPAPGWLDKQYRQDTR